MSLVNREKTHCGGLFVADENYNLNKLLASQEYLNKHPKVPRDFAILPFQILLQHIEETLNQVQELSRQITSTERRIADGRISLEDNGDYKLLNRLNLEHVRLQRRSNFELELGQNLIKYLDAYHRLWTHLWEGGTSYIEDMREKTEQQMRYCEQVQRDLEMMPRRIDNQSKAVCRSSSYWTWGVADRSPDFQLHRPERQQDQPASRRKLSQDCRGVAAGQLVEREAGEGHGPDGGRDSSRQRCHENHCRVDAYVPAWYSSSGEFSSRICRPETCANYLLQSFFSMNGMFNWEPSEGQSLASPYLYVYFVVTIPVTLIVFFGWWWWFRRMEAQYKLNAPIADFGAVESDLMKRMNTLQTNSWSLQRGISEKQTATLGASQQVP